MPTNIRQFMYNATERKFVAEVSDTNGLERVWQDSADLGMVVTNPDTGRSVTFVVTDESRDREGDLVAWMLESVTGTRQDGQYTMCLYND